MPIRGVLPKLCELRCLALRWQAASSSFSLDIPKHSDIAPPVSSIGVKLRIWTDEDIEKVRQVLPSIKNGRKTRYQKTQSAKPRNKKKAKK